MVATEGILSLIDAIETENYRAAEILYPAPYKITRLAGREKVNIVREFVWLQMLNRGLKTWGIAVSDAHTVHGNGVGGWRTYIPSSTDEPSKIDWEEISRRAKAGQMILTTGPFLEVSTQEGIIAGGIARANDSLLLNIKVQCSSWIDIDRIQILINGRADKSLNFTRDSNPNFFRNGIVKFDQKIKISLSEDSHLIVVAYGSNFDLKLDMEAVGNHQFVHVPTIIRFLLIWMVTASLRMEILLVIHCLQVEYHWLDAKKLLSELEVPEN